jgi:hypothetical protein
MTPHNLRKVIVLWDSYIFGHPSFVVHDWYQLIVRIACEFKSGLVANYGFLAAEINVPHKTGGPSLWYKGSATPKKTVQTVTSPGSVSLYNAFFEVAEKLGKFDGVGFRNGVTILV